MNRQEFINQAIYISANTAPPRKRHFRQRGKQAAVAAVMIRQEFVFGDKLLNHAVKGFQTTRIVQIGRFAAHIVIDLTERRAAHACFAEAQIDKQQYAVFDVFSTRA